VFGRQILRCSCEPILRLGIRAILCDVGLRPRGSAGRLKVWFYGPVQPEERP